MSSQTAKTVVLVSGGLLFAMIAIKRATVSDPFRAVWAAGVITLGLSLLADISPEIAGPFAILVVLAFYLHHQGVLGSIPGLSGKQAAPVGPRGPVGTPSTGPAGPRGPVGR